MPLMQMQSGLVLDRPALSPTPYWRAGSNIRSRDGNCETLGLFAPLRDGLGAQITLVGADIFRTIFTTPSPTEGQILIASASDVKLLDFDPLSTPGTGTRWKVSDRTPAALVPAADTITNPSVGRIEIPPVWWFSDTEDVVIGCRTNVIDEPCYAWDRTTGLFTALAASPTGAVGGGIISRILVLLGCTSFTEPDPLRFMTIRWSDRFNFEDWTPSDINVSGELQLEGGSRIMGGGVVGKGVVAWTDKRMALLTETGDPDSVFARRYVDGGRGLMANRAWCEADGNVWWFDETRTLNVWDGGRPVQIVNPIRLATVERISDSDIARAYMVPNQEYGEIILWYPRTEAGEPDTGLVYSYLDKCWSLWHLPRTAWAARVGAIRNLGVTPTGQVFQHDLDTGLSAPWQPAPLSQLDVGARAVAPADTTPYDWFLQSNLVPQNDATKSTYHLTRYLLDHLPCPAQGHEDDSFTIEVRGYGDNTLLAPSFSDAQVIEMGQPSADFRVGGKAIMITAVGIANSTVWRFGMNDSSLGGDGER